MLKKIKCTPKVLCLTFGVQFNILTQPREKGYKNETVFENNNKL